MRGRQGDWAFVASVVALVCVVAPGVSRAESPPKAKARGVLDKLKCTRIISIQDHDKINGIDQEGMAGV